MSFWSRFLPKKKEPVPTAEIVVGLVDIVKQRIEKLVDDVVWSGDKTFSSRDQIIEFIGEVVEEMKPKRIEVETPTDTAVEIIPPKVEINPPNKVVRTRLKPLTINRKADNVSNTD